ncbi:MAG: MBL fold metallo-hydrolase [Alphaproteobacteria bacterium]|nr:MBL fold metallo-hydrolase [Alphaproteobacteria bacterium]
MRVTILGCGGSSGVPLIGNFWGDCDPAEPRNRRRRVSILIEQADTTVLVDASPDLREQLLAAGVNRLTGVVLTHAHADHLHGIDDLRAVNFAMQAPLALHATPATLAEVGARFGYALKPLPAGGDYYRPALVPTPVDSAAFQIGEIAFQCFEQDHGIGGTTLGLRFGAIAYSTDVVRLPPAAFEVLAGVDTWIVDCLRPTPHPTHAHFDQTMEWIARIKPRRAVLTHMGHLMDYRSVAARCPPGVEPGYDGMVLEA